MTWYDAQIAVPEIEWVGDINVWCAGLGDEAFMHIDADLVSYRLLLVLERLLQSHDAFDLPDEGKGHDWVLLVWVEKKPFFTMIRFLGPRVAGIECEPDRCGWLWYSGRCCAVPGFRGLILIQLEQLGQAGTISEKETC
jgi:hypothetical protein